MRIFNESILGAFYDGIDKSKAVIAYLVHEKGIKVIFADPFERNGGSRRALEKNGFKLKEIVVNGGRKDDKDINICKYEYRARS